MILDFNSREYSIRELFDSYHRGETILSPKFQRRPVWDYKAKSYLMDSIISGFPIPRIFIRESTNLDMTATREIVDGQQRLKTIFDFLNDGFRISPVHNKQYGGLYYSELPSEVQKDILKYPVSAVLLIDLDDNAVIDIFARLNTYSVKLNNQELLNSQYFGLFKQLVYKLAQEYRTFWIESGILTEKGISRMDDAKLVTELLIAIVTQKITSNSFEQCKKIYSLYDDEFEKASSIEADFKKTLDLFCRLYGDNFKDTAYSRTPLFYSTFLTIYNCIAPIGLYAESHPVDSDVAETRLKIALDEIDRIATSEEDELNAEEKLFVLTLKKNTTTPDVRIRRGIYISKRINEALK